MPTRRERAEARNFMIGLFMPTMSGGWTVSRATPLDSHRYSYLQPLALTADRYGLDYLFFGGGYPPKQTGEFRFRERMADALALAAALGAQTMHPMVISTVHVLFRHAPLFLAKLAAGIDEVTNGGFGINVVCGLAPNSHEMFDFEDPGDHDERYVAAAEFLQLLCRLWTSDEPIDFDGRYYRTKGAFLDTKPVQQPHPLLVNAGFSEAGQAFAAEYCDWSFIVSDRPTDYDSVTRRGDQIRARAEARGRQMKVCMHPIVLCRETEREVAELREHIWRHADRAELERQYRAYMGPQSRTQSHRQTQRTLEDFLFLGTFQVFGTPEQVTEQLVRLHRAGCDGVHLVFFDWQEDLRFFCERVLPHLRAEVGDTFVSPSPDGGLA